MIGVEHTQGLTCLTFDDAAGNNTLTLRLLDNLLSVLRELPAGTRALLLRSATPVFSYGLDLGQVLADAPDSESEASRGSRGYALLLDTLHRLPFPTLALVQGPCKAGGVGLAVACDLVLCTKQASFQLSEALLGLLPANVSPYLARRVGAQKLLRWTITLEVVDADFAQRTGLADYVADDDKQLDRLARRILKQVFRCSPQALSSMKTFVRELGDEQWEKQQERAERLLAQLLQNEQNQRAIEVFQQGELPPWSQHFRIKGPLALEVRKCE